MILSIQHVITKVTLPLRIQNRLSLIGLLGQNFYGLHRAGALCLARTEPRRRHGATSSVQCNGGVGADRGDSGGACPRRRRGRWRPAVMWRHRCGDAKVCPFRSRSRTGGAVRLGDCRCTAEVAPFHHGDRWQAAEAAPGQLVAMAPRAARRLWNGTRDVQLLDGGRRGRMLHTKRKYWTRNRRTSSIGKTEGRCQNPGLTS